MHKVKKLLNNFFGANFDSRPDSAGAPNFSRATQNIFDPRHWPSRVGLGLL